MKHILFTLLIFLPVFAQASTLLSVCDGDGHDVIIRNGGSERIAKMTQHNGEIEEFGPPSSISFQIKNKPGEKPHPVVVPTSPDEEFCIWSGEIRLQRLNTIGSYAGGGGGSR